MADINLIDEYLNEAKRATDECVALVKKADALEPEYTANLKVIEDLLARQKEITAKQRELAKQAKQKTALAQDLLARGRRLAGALR